MSLAPASAPLLVRRRKSDLHLSKEGDQTKEEGAWTDSSEIGLQADSIYRLVKDLLNEAAVAYQTIDSHASAQFFAAAPDWVRHPLGSQTVFKVTEMVLQRVKTAEEELGYLHESEHLITAAMQEYGLVYTSCNESINPRRRLNCEID